MSKKKGLTPKLQVWADARKTYRLSHAHIQMARELGLNPKKLGKLANHRQEKWKAPLPTFIERLYAKRFSRSGPEQILTIEEVAGKAERRKRERRERGRAGSDSDSVECKTG
ncbi:MAG: hypothetical protein KAW67_10125 [Candidatus Eisenbacteria sp.]|nr:hypothetical protein [Candidatus Eisenbacteria bacterium]